MSSAIVVLAYVLLGGLSSAIYNEVLQFFLIVAGFLPLVYLGLRDAGGWSGIVATVPPPLTHAWRGFGSAATSPMGVDGLGMAMGLGFVLSFGYWCTDFLVVQRAMAADSMTAARRTPLIAAFPKMLFPFLVVLPGLIALSVHGGVIPVKLHEGTNAMVLDALGRPQLDYDLTVPTLLLRYFPTGMLGLGLTALLASFMSGMAGNVTAFNTVWTYDIYQAYLRPQASDAHYLWVGRMATVFGIAASVLTAYVAAQFNNIMDVLQLVFAFVNAPLLATFLLGMFWKRATGPRRVHRAGRRHRRRGAAPRAHAAGRRDRRRQRRMARGRHHLSERDGAELLDRDRRVHRLPAGDGGGQPADEAAPRRRARRPGLLAHREAARCGARVVQAAGGPRRHRAGGDRHAQPGVLLMGLDVRLPVGLMFAIMGALLVGYGLFGDHTIYARSLGINVNVIWGTVLLVTGGIFLALAARGRAA